MVRFLGLDVKNNITARSCVYVCIENCQRDRITKAETHQFGCHILRGQFSWCCIGVVTITYCGEFRNGELMAC